MRVGVFGPKGWARLPQGSYRNSAEEWIRQNTIYLRQKSLEQGDILEAITTLHVGIDLASAKIFYEENIPYHVILSCSKQSAVWDEEKKAEFSKYLNGARSVKTLAEGDYIDGCIKNQFAAVIDWIAESETGRTVLLIKHFKFSDTQRTVIKTLGAKSIIKVFK